MFKNPKKSIKKELAMKNLLSIILTISILTSIIIVMPITAKAANTADSLVSIAQGESGSSNYSKYYGGHKDSWCADFVTWCAQQAGVSSITNTSVCETMYNGMISNGCQKVSSPKKGDIIFYTYSGRIGHVGIMVDSVNMISGNMVIKEGETRRVLTIKYTSFLGGSGFTATFVRPKYNGSTPVTTGNNPIGYLDSVSSPSAGKIRVTGWALDLDSPTSSITVHIYVGGKSGDKSAESHAITANTYRNDVGNAYSKYGVGNYHGFDATFSTSKTGTQSVYAYGINIKGGNTNPLLTNSPRSVKITPAYNPMGYLDKVDSPAPGKLHVRGWALDLDSPKKIIAVHIYVGGKAGDKSTEGHAITANTYRNDVGSAYSKYGVGNYHGFDVTLSTSKTGTQSVYAYGINIEGGNTNPLLTNSPKTVSIKKDTESPKITNITISQLSNQGYRVTCKISDNVKVTSVKFPTWTLKADGKGNNQDDLIWHVGTINDNTATFYVKRSDHKNEYGNYVTDVYAYDAAGNYSTGRAGTTLADTPSEISSITYNGNTYKVFNSAKSWTQAKIWCQNNGGHLATISDKSEWNAIKELLKKYNGTRCWLGAEKTSGIWKWITGEKVAYYDWDTGQPDCNHNKEFYLGTFNSGKFIDCYKWNDFENISDTVGGFVCEFEKKTPESDKSTTESGTNIPTELQKSDTFKYTLNLTTSKAIKEGQLIIYYPSSVVKVKSIKFDTEFLGVNPIYNYNIPKYPGEIDINFSNSNKGIDFTKKHMLCEATFEVIGTGKGKIYVSDKADEIVFLDVNGTNIKPVFEEMISGIPNHSSTTKTTTETKKNNSIKITVHSKTIKAKKLKKNAQTIKALTVKNAKGNVTYKLVKKGTGAKIYKYLKINKKGVITFKKWKKAKKGTYKIKITVTAKGNSKYNAKSVTKVINIKIK